MRSWIVRASQLIQIFSFLVHSAVPHPAGQLEIRGEPESQQEFDQTTTSFEEQGLCRAYLKTGMTIESVSTCGTKCGDLVQKAQDAGDTTSLSCVSGGVGIPTITDPDGNQWNAGQCVCDIPILEEVIEDVLLTLPAIAEIGCEILFSAFDTILEIGVAAIPGVGPEMSAGMKAGIQAAKTITQNGQKASSFLQWFTNPCGKSKYTDMVDQIFDPLSSVPDSVVPGLGCKGKKCPGKDPNSPGA
ncbi:MAG: hypothetical protein L6R39_004455 [Caloplaca ligustica]|nr:MAG: hypothetical protein L6R39_004455 [Caloplaca ligustica]